MDNGSMEKQNLQGTDITIKKSRKGNVECKDKEGSVTIDKKRYTEWKVG